MFTCKINEIITIKLEEIEVEDYRDGPGGKRYVAGYRMMPRIVFYINGEDNYHFEKEVFEYYAPEIGIWDHDLRIEDLEELYSKLCSDLESWEENNYDHTKTSPILAFMLLKTLYKLNNLKATQVYEKEVLKGLESNNPKLRDHLERYGYRDLLRRRSFWDQFSFNTTPLEEIEKIINKKLRYIPSKNSRDPWKDIAAIVVEDQRLTGLILEGCELTEIPKQVFQLKSLEYLNLSKNQLTSIPEMLKELKNLRELKLRENLLTNFPKCILEMKTLESLFLNDLKELPEEIINLRKLKNFSFIANNMKKFPTVLCFMKTLQSLYVRQKGECFTIWPAAREFLYQGSHWSHITMGGIHNEASDAWFENYERNKKQCQTCKKDKNFHSDNFPMCYECLMKNDVNFISDPLAYVRELPDFNFEDWEANKCHEKFMNEDIEKSKKSGGIFSYPQEILDQIILFNNSSYQNFPKAMTDLKILPVIMEVINRSTGPDRSLFYEVFSERLTKRGFGIKDNFHRNIERCLREGYFFRKDILEEIDRKLKNDFLPEINSSLEVIFLNFSLRGQLKNHNFRNFENIHSFEGGWEYDPKIQRGYAKISSSVAYTCSYTILGKTPVVSCKFKQNGPWGPETYKQLPQKVMKYSCNYLEIETDEYPGLTFPVPALKDILFLSDLETTNMKVNEIQSHLQEEIKEICDFISLKPKERPPDDVDLIKGVLFEDEESILKLKNFFSKQNATPEDILKGKRAKEMRNILKLKNFFSKQNDDPNATPEDILKGKKAKEMINILKSNIKFYEVNDFISLKLEGNKTNIYIKGKRFTQCMRLVLNIPLEKIVDYEQIESIDEASEKYKNSEKLNGRNKIPPEVEFWAHCSNIQVWAEHDYNTKLMSSNLAFPLLKKLVELGDKKAKKVFKEEVAKRFISGYFNATRFLSTKGYLQDFTREELETLFEEINFKNVLSWKRKYLFDWLKVLINRGINQARIFFKELVHSIIKDKQYDDLYILLKSSYLEILEQDEINSLFENFDYHSIKAIKGDKFRLLRFYMRRILRKQKNYLKKK